MPRFGSGLQSEYSSFWSRVFPGLFRKAIDLGSVQGVRQLLAMAHDVKPIRLTRNWISKHVELIMLLLFLKKTSDEAWFL